jgi:5-methylcytosine-specific restriction endonuclease McrA
MGYRLCLTCNAHHPVGYRCPKVEAKRYQASAARKARGRHAWRVARAAARQRDGNRCRRCGGTQRLQVHHLIPISEGGERYALDNLITLCSGCHAQQHGGERGSTGRKLALPRASNPRNKPQPRRFSHSVLKNVSADEEGPLIG